MKFYLKFQNAFEFSLININSNILSAIHMNFIKNIYTPKK